MKKRGFTEIILVLLTVLVFLAVFTVLLALIYPTAAKNIIADVSQSYESDHGGPVGVMGKIAKRGADGFNARVVPAFRWIGKRLADIFGRKKVVVVGNRQGPDFKAKDCVKGECHQALFDQKAFAHIYIDHRLHEASDVKCRKCHLDTKHPKPHTIKQDGCLDCHRRQAASTGCLSCHPPGSILNDAVIPAQETKDFLHGSVVSSKSLLPAHFGAPDPGWLKGEGDPPCRNCHQVPEFCNRCHLVFHNKIPNWRLVHGPRLLKQEYVMNVCWTCHNATWCAGNCHINQGVKRSGPYLDLPQVPLETYIR